MQIPNLIEALAIIAKQEPEAWVNVGHDEIFIGEYNPEKHTPEDLARLDELGWFEDEDAWGHFV